VISLVCLSLRLCLGLDLVSLRLVVFLTEICCVTTLRVLAAAQQKLLAKMGATPPAIPTCDTPSRPPCLPRRSSSLLHRAVIAKLRPLPFQYVWAVWHSKPSTDTKYGLTLLAENVADIGVFYRIYNNVPWDSIKLRESIHFFRAGVQPMWEDRENLDGGCWVIKVRRDDGRAIRAWEEICLLCCGGEIQAAIAPGKGSTSIRDPADTPIAEGDHVLGMSYSPRLYWAHISVWTRRGDNMRSVEVLQKTIIAGLSPDLRPKSEAEYYFKKHSDHTGWNEAVKHGNPWSDL